MERLKIVVLGDSHGEIKNLDFIMKDLKDTDYIIHTGDYFNDGEYIAKNYGMNVIGVRGNCDFTSQGEEEIIKNIGGKRFFIAHGHQYGIKYDLNRFFYRGRELDADIIIFGHSHMPYYSVEDGIILLNPGSISQPRGGSFKSFAIVRIEKGEISAEIISID